jgi:hypothetical protein
MRKLKEKLKEQIMEYEDKVKKMPSARLASSDIQNIHMISDTLKNLCKIEMYEQYEDGESHDAYEEDSSYRRGRMRAKRDSMGRYSRDDGYSENRGNGSYSYGNSKEDMLATIEEMKREIEQM